LKLQPFIEETNMIVPQNNRLPEFKEVILGIDIGTSGVRGCLVEVESNSGDLNHKPTETLLLQKSVPMVFPEKNELTGASTQDSQIWTQAFETLFLELSKSPSFKRTTRIVADATSSTVLLCNPNGDAVTQALMYDDQQAKQAANKIQARISGHHLQSAATGASCTLAKVLHLISQLDSSETSEAVICHQIDWFNLWLTGTLGVTDENNALKLGYDSINDAWPDWVIDLIETEQNRAGLVVEVPKVLKPGAQLAVIRSEIADQFGLSESVKVHAGTTDSIAGFLASGAEKIGDAVSSLGSTLAVKIISKRPVFNQNYGIYSHRLGNNWLVGGASNVGGAVLLAHFSIDEMNELMTMLIKSESQPHWQTMALPDYYPLIKLGERFPIADSGLQPKLPPKPTSPEQVQQAEFLLGLTQGLTRVEQLGYQRLEDLGAGSGQRLFSVGGGTKNRLWTTLRQQHLPFQQAEPDSLDAAFGVTRLVSKFYNQQGE